MDKITMVNRQYENITFIYSIEEMRKYLIEKCYTLQEIDIYTSQSVYHNKVEIVEGTMLIAYKGVNPYPNHKEESIFNGSIKEELSLVFRDELKKNLLTI